MLPAWVQSICIQVFLFPQVMPKNSAYPHRIKISWATQVALATLTFCSLAASSILLSRFLAPISWGIALTITIYPLYMRTIRQVPYPTSVALLFTSALGIGVIMPTVWASHTIISTAIDGARALTELSTSSLWNTFLRDYPEAAHLARNIFSVLSLEAFLTRLSMMLEAQAQHIIRSSVKSGLHVLIALGIVFFSLRDSSRLLRGLRALIPLPAWETNVILHRVLDTIHSVIFGIVAVALLHGFLGALLLWWLEIPGLLLWSVIMTLLALVPYLGTFIIWIPLSLMLFLEGDWLRGIFTIAWGSIVIGLSDNVLYPWLVGKRLHYHPLILFLFLFGGILVVGPSGVIVGPVILAISDRLLWVWRRRL